MSITDARLTQSGGLRGLQAGAVRVMQDYEPEATEELVRTALVSQATTNPGTGSTTSASFTPPDHSLLVALSADCGSGDVGGDFSTEMTITDSAGLTWTSRVNVGEPASGSYAQAIRLWTAPVTTGVPMTVTRDVGSRNIGARLISVVAYTGYDILDPIGATAGVLLAQHDGPGSVTLSVAPAATSEIFGGRGGGVIASGVSAAEPGAGITEIHDLSVDGGGGLQTQARPPGSTSTTFDWADLSNGGAGDLENLVVAIEIKSVAGAAWAPVYLPNLAMWYDAADAESFTYSSGSTILQWKDKSGANRHLTTSSGGATRSGSRVGLKTVVFTGDDDLITGTFTSIPSPVTVYVVLKTSNATGQFFNSQGGVEMWYNHTLSVWRVAAGAGPVSNAMGADVWHVAGAVFDGAGSSSQRLDGTQVSTTNPGTNGLGTSLEIGSWVNSTWFVGEIAEMVICSTVLSPAETRGS